MSSVDWAGRRFGELSPEEKMAAASEALGKVFAEMATPEFAAALLAADEMQDGS